MGTSSIICYICVLVFCLCFDGCKKLVTFIQSFFLINVNCCCMCDATLSNYCLRVEGDKRTKTWDQGDCGADVSR